MANDFFANASQNTAEKNRNRRRSAIDRYFEQNPGEAAAQNSGWRKKKKQENPAKATETATKATEGPVKTQSSSAQSASPTLPGPIQTPELDKAVGNGPQETDRKALKREYDILKSDIDASAMVGIGATEAQAARLEELRKILNPEKEESEEQKAAREKVKEYKTARAELQAAAESGGFASAELAEREREAEAPLRELGIASDQRAVNIGQGAARRVGAGLSNALATAIDATALSESAKDAYDPLYNADIEARYGGDREKYIQEIRESAHEGVTPIYDAADRMGENAAKDLEQAKLGLGKMGQVGVDIAENLLEMGFDAAVGAATGAVGIPGGGLGSMFLRVLGNAEQEARQSGATLEQQLAYGITSAGIELLTEKVSGMATKVFGYGAGAADEFTEQLIGKLAETDTGRSALRLLFGAVSEGGEEVLSDVLSPIAEAMYKTDENGNLLSVWDLGKERLSAEGLAEMAYDFLIGAAVGAIGGGTNILTGQDAKANAELRAREAQAQPTSEFNSTSASESTNPAEVMAQLAEGATAPQTASEGPIQTVQGILAGTVSNSKAESILADPALKAAFEQMSGQELSGTKSEQRAAVKAFAQALQAGETTTESKTAPGTNPLAEALMGERAEAALPQTPEAQLAAAQNAEAMMNPGTFNETAPAEQAPPGQLRSQSEANTIQAVDEQVGAPQEVRNPLYYTPVSEAESMAQAQAMLENGYQSNAPAIPSSSLTPEQSAALTAAGERLGGGYGQAIADMQSAPVWTGVQQDMSLLMFKALAKDAQQSGDWSAYMAWREIDAKHGEWMARALQARGKATRGTTQDLMDYVTDTIKSAGLSEAEQNAAMARTMAYAKEYDAIDKTDTDSLIDLIKRVNGQRGTGILADKLIGGIGKLTGAYGWDMNILNWLLEHQSPEFLSGLARAQIKGMALDYTPVTWGDRIKTIQSIFQLGRVTTFLRNIYGNASFGVALEGLVQDLFGIGIDAAVSAKTGARSVGFNALGLRPSQFKGMADSLGKSILSIALDADMGAISNNKYDPRPSSFRHSGNAVERFAADLSQILKYSLSSSDAGFRGSLEAGTNAELTGKNINRELRQKLGEEKYMEQVSEAAGKDADYRLFQNLGAAATVSKGAHDLMNVVGFGGKRGTQGLSRFMRSGGFGAGDLFGPTYPIVPANLAVKPLEYSPFGIAKGVIDLCKVIKSAKNGNISLAEQRNAVMEISRGMAGIPLAAMFAALFKAGVFKRSKDEDDYAVTKAREIEGRKETQWNVDATMRLLNGEDGTEQKGDTFTDLNYLEPLNAYMTIGAMFEAAQEEDDDALVENLATSYIMGSWQSFMEMPLADNLQSAFQSTKYVDEDNVWEKAGKMSETAAINAVSGMYPGLISSIATATDPVTRDTAGDTFGEQLVNVLKNKTPGLRQTLPAKLNSLGQPIVNENKTYNAMNALVSPGARREFNPNETVQALEEVLAATGKSNFYPEYKAPAKVSFGDTDYELNTDEKRQWQETYGQKYDALIRATEDSPQFADMDAATKAKVYSQINSMAKAEANGELVNSRGGEYKSDYDSVLALSDIPGYLAAKAQFTDASDKKNRDYDTIDSVLKNYAKLPDDVKKKLDTGNTEDMDKLYDAWSSGVKAEDWFAANDAVKALKPVDGKEDVADWQKYKAIADTATGVDADKILKSYMSESTYSRYMQARKSGIAAKTWCKVNAGISQIKPADGKKNRTEWQEYEYIVQNHPNQAKAILSSFIDSEGNRTRLNNAVDYGITPEQWVAYYKQDQLTNSKNDKGESVTGLKKSRMQEWALSYGLSKKQFQYLYSLTNAHTNELADFNKKFK